VGPVQGQQQEKRAAHRLYASRQVVDPALVEAIGDVAGRQNQQEHGRKLAQADKPQRQRRTLHVIDLPADGDGLDLDGQGGK
jgi:hypothetical protein